ncbi:MAG TPA: DUF2950 family protein [Terriglobales bacterium]|nr:DUF2950 family protein [Terriglobales bacterium]
MTFIVGTDGVIYQRDLGEKTTETAATMTEYSPDEGWTPEVNAYFRVPLRPSVKFSPRTGPLFCLIRS